MITLTIQGEMTSLNEFLRKLSYNRFAGGAVKKSETERVFWECKSQKLKKVKKYPVFISFKWYCKNHKKDWDNVCFAKKFILDGLVMAAVISNDSQQFVKGFSDEFFIDSSNPRVEVEIYENRKTK